MLDQRSYKLFVELVNHERMTKSEVMQYLNLTERQLQYDLEKINDTLTGMELDPIELQDQSFNMSEAARKFLPSELFPDIDTKQFIISEGDRELLIYLYTFIRQGNLSNYHYQWLLGVSKNTALADVKKLKTFCEKWRVSLVYTRNAGYHLNGSELDKRRIAFYCIDYLLSQPLGKEIIILALKSWGQENNLVFMQEMIDSYLEEHSIDLVKSRKNEAVFHLVFVYVRSKSEGLAFSDFEKQLIQRQSLYQKGVMLAQRIFGEDCSENESYFVTIQLLVSQQEVFNNENPFLQELSQQLINEFEKNTLLPIKSKDFFERSIYNHLVPAFFRIMFEMPIVNIMTPRIKADYPELFQFVKKSLAPLSMWTGKTINEDEVGFFTLLFGGYLERTKKTESIKLKAVIICSNGLSSSIMIKAQLREMFPDIRFSSVHTVQEFNKITSETFDMVFSTIDVVSAKPVFKIKPLLSKIEKKYLIQMLLSKFPMLENRTIPVNQIMEIINKHADVKNEHELFSELTNLLYSNNIERGSYKPMLSTLLTEDMIHFTDEELEWRESIRKVSYPLVKTNKIQNDYVEAMIKNVEEIGTYIHIGKGIAIPHARPEAGVNNLGMSFLRTRTPVKLLGKEDHKIDIFICLAAIDSDAHLRALAQLTRLLGDDVKLEALKAAESSQQVIEIIKEGEEKE
ncbi:BglG family transcription antiterminator [Salimicrobium album]|uniref:Ascorbate-specific PTS system EIIA component n=1 Tax=Salimicrobium album TaxID=50717 RepID=A0A1H3H6J8_9BACI|nr:BglG family transcription antiterminator [Salimicrobium album]SDY11183.1 transcriptional antiterminator, BglG family [Salimicrobium album]